MNGSLQELYPQGMSVPDLMARLVPVTRNKPRLTEAQVHALARVALAPREAGDGIALQGVGLTTLTALRSRGLVEMTDADDCYLVDLTMAGRRLVTQAVTM
jgi:hypothetical protein